MATPTSTSVSVSGTLTVGSSVTITATVSPSVNGGTVQFYASGGEVGSQGISGSTATYNYTLLNAGSIPFYAYYTGDAQYSSSTSSTVNYTVSKQTPGVTCTSSVNPTQYGGTTNFNATFSYGGATPTGNITYKDTTTSTTLGTEAYGAALPYNALAVGSHAVTAAYAGDSNYNSKTSSPLTQTVNKVTTTTSVSLTSGSNPSTYGGSLTFTATVTSGATGTVTFSSSINGTLGTISLSGTTAALTTSTLSAGSHTITATYNGATNYATSYGTVGQTVNKASTSVTWSTPAAITYGTALSGTQLNASGSVSGNIVYSPVSGTVLGAGAQTLTATFTPADSTDYSGSSKQVTLTVNKAVLTVTANNASRYYGQSNPAFSATYSGFVHGDTSSVLSGSPSLTCSATSGSAPGGYTIVAAVGSLSAANYSFSFVNGTLTVSKANTTTSVARTSGSNPSTYGSSLTFTATVTSGATGSVTFYSDGVSIGTGTLSGTTTSLNYSLLAIGSHTITAAYNGNVNYNGSTSSGLSQTVNKVPTMTSTPSPSANPSTYGNSVTFTVTVTSGATGTVTFYSDSSQIGSPAALSSGTASLAYSGLAVGAHSITATYNGDSTYLTSTSSALTQTVNQISTAVSLGSSLNPSVYNNSVTLTATVTPGGTTAETVTFYDNGVSIGTRAMSGGVATLSTSSLSIASHPLTASYPGNTNYAPSSSSTLTQVVNKANVSVSVESSLNPSGYDVSVTFNVTVGASGTTGTPTGSVTFSDNVSGTAPFSNPYSLVSGSASASTSALTAGNHTITATYSGDSNFLTGNGSVGQTVSSSLTTTTTIVSGNTSPSGVGVSVTFIATVSGSGGTPTGNVVLSDSYAGTLATQALSGRTTTFSISTLDIAHSPHTVTATYGGDSNFSGSYGTASQTVQLNTPTVSIISSKNPSYLDDSVTFTVNVSGSMGTPTGTVQFKDGGTNLGSPVTLVSGACSYTTSSLTASGSPHTIHAAYSGSGVYASGDNTVSQVVNLQVATVTVASSQTPCVTGTAISFTVTVTGNIGTPTGNVTSIVDSVSGTLFSNLPLSGGTVTSGTTSALSIASHTITATYGGDSSYASNSGGMTQVVTSLTTTTTALGGSPNPGAAGNNVLFTATVAAVGGGGPPTGDITFTDTFESVSPPVVTLLGVVALDGTGKAYLETDTLAEGVHIITATYGGS